MESLSESRRYRVLEVLGRGGFGTVYRAELLGRDGFTKQVALKVLNPGIEAQPGALERLRDEARMLGLLQHRAIVTVDSLVKLDGRWTIVMEYVRGASLKQLVDALGPLPVAVVLEILEEVASALRLAYHTTDATGSPLRLLHRDLKPSNVQLTPSGHVKLLDFGVARAEFDTREAHTRSQVYGSVAYMAPERLELTDSHASDVYALGITLVELVSGRVPGRPRLDRQRHQELVDASLELVHEVVDNADLDALLRLTLAFAPSARPDAREFGRSLRRIRSDLPPSHLSDWAEQVLPGLLDRAEPDAGEYSGMVLAEAGTSQRHRDLKELVGHTAPTTFDDLDGETDEASRFLYETPPPPPSERSTVAEPPPPPRILSEDPPTRHVPETARRRGRSMSLGRTLVGLVLSTLLLAVLAGSAMFLGSSALFGGLLVAIWPEVEVDVCLENVQETQDLIRDRRGKGVRGVGALMERATSACSKRTLSSWEAVQWQGRAEDLTTDGTLSDADLEVLDAYLEELESD